MKRLLKWVLFTIAGITMIGSVITALADDTLKDGERLYASNNDTLSSNNGKFKLIMQSDSDLVLYDVSSNNTAIWDTGTTGQDVEFCVMQGDGNLVLYRPDGQPVWASNTAGNPGAFLKVQNDGNMVIDKIVYTSIWSSDKFVNTVHPIPAPGNTPPGGGGCPPPPRSGDCPPLPQAGCPSYSSYPRPPGRVCPG